MFFFLIGRDWDYDWTLPNVNRDGDIPLGYAAADAYAPQRHKHKHGEGGKEESRSRGRNRLRQRIHLRNAGTQHYLEQNGYDSDQSPTRGTQEMPGHVQGHFVYHPQQHTTPLSPQQQTAHAQQGGKMAQINCSSFFSCQICCTVRKNKKICRHLFVWFTLLKSYNYQLV